MGTNARLNITVKDGNATITLSPDGGGNYSAASIAAFKELIAKLQDDQCIGAEYTVGSYMYDLDGLTFTTYGLLEKDGKTFVSELTVTGPGETPPPDPDPDKPPFPPAAPAGEAPEKGVVTGYLNGLFGPEDPIIRAQAAQMLKNLFAEPAR